MKQKVRFLIFALALLVSMQAAAQSEPKTAEDFFIRANQLLRQKEYEKLLRIIPRLSGLIPVMKILILIAV
jgi:hypothetical protein